MVLLINFCKGVSEDCISELPDQILVCVLSHLTVREALATSVLSRRWRYLWAYSTRLDFDSKNALGKLIINQSTERPRYVEWVDRFVECVDHVLGEYEVPTLDEFKISFDLDQRSTESINSWVEFAMTRPVQRLEMDLLGIRPYHYFQNLYYKQSCGCSPKQFSLNLPRICPPTSLGFKFLKDFYLKNVSITTEVLEYFLANCPNLERLSVFGSRHLVKLRVSGSYPSLKHLEVVSCINLQSMEICDTNLISFKYVKMNMILKNVPLLVDVYIGVGSSMYVANILHQLSCCFSQLQVLTLQLCDPITPLWLVFTVLMCLFFLSIPYVVILFTLVLFLFLQFDEEVGLFPQSKNLKKLVVEVRAQNFDELLELTPLIIACPYLQILVLKVGVY